MPLSEKPIHHEPHVETLHRSRDENAPERQSFGVSDANAPQLAVPGAKEQQRDTFQQGDYKQERNTFNENSQQEYFVSNSNQQHYDATLPATVIVERETEPVRTIVEYEKAPIEQAGSSYFGGGRADKEFTQPSEFRSQDYTTQQRGSTERNFEGSSEQQTGPHFGASSNTTIPWGSTGGAEVRREPGDLSESGKFEAQGKHFEGMMEQEIKDEESFEEGRRHIKEDFDGPQRHHHHRHHHHHDKPQSDDERGAAQESAKGLKPNPSDSNLPQTHSSAAAYNADTNQLKPAPTSAAQPPPFDKAAPAPLADKAPANPNEAFPESKNQAIKGDTGALNTTDSKQSSAGHLDTQPTDVHPNPNTTGAKDGTSDRKDGGMDQPNQLPKEGSAGLSEQNKGTTDAALSKDRLPKEGAESGSHSTAPTGAPLSRPPGSADRVLPPAKVTDLPTDNKEKDKLGAPAPAGAPFDSRPPGSADRVLPTPASAAGSSTAPPGVPPGSTAPLPPPATDEPDLDKHEDEEHKGGMRGKMHHMMEKMHIGHHKEKEAGVEDKDAHLNDQTATGGPITSTK